MEFFALHGRHRRIFTNSLADWCDNEIPESWRHDAWTHIGMCRHAEWYIVTKRISNFLKMLPIEAFAKSTFGHIVLIITVVNQEDANRDIPRLTAIQDQYPWLRIGLSIEPMQGPIVLKAEWLRKLNWVIVGGESGAHARAMPFAWVKPLLDACTAYAVPFHFKQVGHNHDGWGGMPFTGKGANPEEWPLELRNQEFPRAA